MASRRLAATMLLGLLVMPAAADATEGRPRPAPEGGYGRLPWQSWIDPAIAPPRPAWQYQQRIIYAFDKPAGDILIRDAGLSRLCRQGQFLQRINLHYRAFGPDERPLGVGFGNLSANLVDPQRQRQPDTAYFFRDQDTGRCEVFSAKLDDLRPYLVGP